MLITNGTVITGGSPGGILPDHAVYISGDRIREVGPSGTLERRYPRARKLDAHGQYVLPGAISAHTHFYSVFARALSIPPPAPKDFLEILERLWWPLDRSLSQDDVRCCALIGLAEAIRHGTTTLFDHHASQRAIDGSLDVIAEAVDESGLRAVLCYEVSDRDGPAAADAAIKENVRFLRRLSANPHPRLAGVFGLHASLTLSGATLQACRASLPDGAGFHVHVAESEADEYDSLGKSNMRVVDRLNNHGILGPRTVAAHCVHVDAREIQLLAETGTWVSHQPRSNMANAVGAAPVESMLRAGVRVCLGDDGFSNVTWDEWKAAYFLQKVVSHDPRRLSASQIAEIAISNNGALAGAYFPAAPIGQVAAGAFADLILVDYQSPTPLDASNWPSHLISGFETSMVTTTIASGTVLMKDRKLVTLDEAEIRARARELAPRLWRKFEEESRR